MTSTVSRTRSIPTPRVAPATSFRLDIQGLRAIAVSMVVIYHLWPNRLTGGFAGVDVFFVISGFLITGHLLRHTPGTGSDLGSFWARRIRRLLPASLLVLFVTTIGTWLLAPSSTWETTARSIIASVFYVGNWDLAASSVDYLASDNVPSPVQHFWSLGVEEQFYLVWPIVFLAIGFMVRRRLFNARAFLTVTAAIVVASFAYGVWLTGAEPSAAYFVTPARLWELAIGGVIAIVVAQGRWLRMQAVGLGAWLGLGLIVFSAFWIDGTMPFPGVVAALPVVGTALVLLCGGAASLSPYRLLAVRPAQFLGDISYAVYLWHWPLIVLAPAVTGTIGLLDKALLLVATIALAWATTRYVEPVFRSGRSWQSLRRTYVGGLSAMLIAAGAGGALWAHAALERQATEAHVAELAAGTADCFGAGALPTSAGGPGGCDITGDELALTPIAAKTDKSQAYDDGCWSSGDFSDRPTCTYGDGDIRVALVGNSHAGQWLGPLAKLAEQRNWTITTFLASRCNATTDIALDFPTEAESDGCINYANFVREQTTNGSFDAIIVSQRQSVTVEGQSWETTEAPVVDSQARMLDAWQQADVPVMVIRDTPTPGAAQLNVPDCVAANETDLNACNGTTADWYWMDPLATAAKDFTESTTVLDPSDWLCPDGTCRAVIGSVITYFDASHITNTYALTLAPLIDTWLDNNPQLGL